MEVGQTAVPPLLLQIPRTQSMEQKIARIFANNSTSPTITQLTGLFTFWSTSCGAVWKTAVAIRLVNTSIYRPDASAVKAHLY